MNNVIIIPVHNQLGYLIPCIESVYTKTINPKVIIVDDYSDKDTTLWINSNKLKYGYDIIRHNDMAHGFTKSVNDGIKYALEHYDFICLCLLNSDTVINTNDWFSKVRYYFESGENIGVASVMSNNALAQSVTNVDKYIMDIDNKPAVYSVFVHGFCYFISKKLINDVGLLNDEIFPHYGSEDDYSLMSLKASYKNLLVGNVFVYHENNKSYTEAQRTAIIRKSYPALQNKWGRGLISRCYMVTCNAGKYVNLCEPKT